MIKGKSLTAVIIIIAALSVAIIIMCVTRHEFVDANVLEICLLLMFLAIYIYIVDKITKPKGKMLSHGSTLFRVS